MKNFGQRSDQIQSEMESLEAKRALPWEKREPDASGEYYQITEPFIDRMWRNTNRIAEGVDIHCKAGSVVICE